MKNPPRTDLVVARLYEVLDGVSSVLRDDRDAIKNLLANGASAVAEVNKLLVENRAQLGELIGGGLAAREGGQDHARQGQRRPRRRPTDRELDRERGRARCRPRGPR